ncbi:hypothetical protein [Alkalihalobacillus sp. BA299]|uniref:hypothetical protein n=1 Tax=Alkalihalobacillus sp. BA299 TaxID=2815938 RepID=UPI001ADAD9C3|nr:hypothetical protein [Alkalihalobacillus sp. BA299]
MNSSGEPKGERQMIADNAFLIALVNKLTEIQENTSDIDTEIELGELIDAIVKSIR